MSWTKMPALTEKQAGLRSGCNICGPQPTTLPLEAELAVGFGACTVSKDGDGVYQEDHHSDNDPPTLQKFEDMAKKDPDHDWRVFFYGALSETEYQRHGDGEWVLIRKGEGFA